MIYLVPDGGVFSGDGTYARGSKTIPFKCRIEISRTEQGWSAHAKCGPIDEPTRLQISGSFSMPESKWKGTLMDMVVETSDLGRLQGHISFRQDACLILVTSVDRQISIAEHWRETGPKTYSLHGLIAEAGRRSAEYHAVIHELWSDTVKSNVANFRTDGLT